ncbi:TPA: hypothetical protein ACPJY0_001768, partial [Haemophilus influenzae]
KIVLDDDSLTEYLRWFLMQPKQKAYFEQASGASTRASLNSSTFKGINITIPSKLVLSYFSNISDLYLKNSKFLKEENSSIRNIRDGLLPKLLNGEIQSGKLKI